MQKLVDWSRTLENSSEILDQTTQAQKDYLEVTRDLAKDLEKGGIVNAGIEGFRNSLKDAMMSISDPSMGAKDIGRNMLLGVLGSIQAEASGRFADNFTNLLFNRQQGGVINAQNGMYISGNRTGDKNPAMLEDGEYVLNRNAVQAMGGARAIDSLNFGMAPRFAGGGGFGKFMGGIGKGLMLPFTLIGKLFSGIFGGGGRSGTAASSITSAGTSIQSGNIRKFTESQSLLDQLTAKESVLRKNISQYGSSASTVLSGEQLSNRYRNMASIGAKSGGKAAMAYYDNTLDIYGPNAFNKLVGENNKPITRDYLIKVLKSQGVTGFQGGGVFSGVSAKHRRRALEKFGKGAYWTSPMGGAALGGGGMGIGLDYFDPMLSSKAHASDPTLQAMRGFFRNERQKDIQKRFEKQAKRDQLTQAVVGTAISLGLEDATTGFKGLKAMGSGMKGWVADQKALKSMGSTFAAAGGREAFAQQQGYASFDDYRMSGDFHGGDPNAPAGQWAYQHRPSIDPRLGIAKRARLDQMRGPIDITTARNPGRINAFVGRPQIEVAPGVYVDDVPTKTAVPGSGLVGGKFYPSGPQNVGRVVDSTDFPSGRKLVPLSSGHRGTTKIGPGTGPEGADLIRLYKESSRLLERIDRATKRLEGMSEGQRDLYLLRGLGDRSGLPRQRGGSIDNIPAMLTGGEFVVNAGAVKRYGSNTLQYMNRGGMVGPQKFVPGEENGGEKQKPAESSTNNNTVNISVNMGNNGGLPTVNEDASGTTPNTASGGKELGRKIRDAVLQVIEEEKRVGGTLRNPYAKNQ